jgi:coatomer protein complex subunit alpha (xenin)
VTAKSHGLDDECRSILEISGLTEEQIKVPDVGEPLQPPKPIVPTYKANLPAKARSHSYFEKVLFGEVSGDDDETAPVSNGFDHVDKGAEVEAQTGKGSLGDDEEEDAAGWDMGDDLNIDAGSDLANVDSATAGADISEAEMWARNSPIAADHVAGGSFETAMQLLNRQVGAVNFAPLQPRFLEIYRASKTYLPASAGLPPLVNYVRRTLDETDPRKVLPLIPRDLEILTTVDLQEGYGAMRSNKLDEGLATFKRLLHCLMVNAVATQLQVNEAKSLIVTATEYATAMALELERRSLSTDDEANVKRGLELSAYFTIPKLQVAHRQLALMAAMKLAFTHKNYSSALSFANRMLANGGSAARMLDQAKKIKAQCERSPQDKIDIEFDQFAEFDVCASSFTPIYGGSPSAACPFDGSKHHSQYQGKLCRICEVCEIGAPASGIRLFASST